MILSKQYEYNGERIELTVEYCVRTKEIVRLVGIAFYDKQGEVVELSDLLMNEFTWFVDRMIEEANWTELAAEAA